MYVLWPLLLTILLGIVLKAFYSAAELVFASADIRRLEEEAEGGKATAKRLLALLLRRERVLGTALIGGTIAVVVATAAAAIVLADHLPAVPWIPAGLALGVVMALLGEIIPRAWANAHVHEAAPRFILPIRASALLFAPFLWFVTGASRLFARIFHNPDGIRAFITREELRAMLHDGAGEEIKPLERQMLSRVLDFSEIKVEEVMVPLIEVHAVSQSATLQQATAVLVAEGHSRLPVYSERIDNVVGLLFAFDALYAEDMSAPVSSLMRPARYVPETTSIDKVLADLQKSRMGLAIVVDEYGGAVGLITIEDILEQIVGDIEDEFDRRAQMLRRIGPQEYVVNARLKIERLAQTLGVPLPEGDYETVGGMLLAELGRIPRAGETLHHGHLVFTVRKATERAINEVLVLVKPPASRNGEE